MNVTHTNPFAADPNMMQEIGNARASGEDMGAAEFLRLLVVQLTSQDPMNPMEDTAFIAQMSSFTSLEQMRTLTTDFAEFRQQHETSAAYNFLGKQVTIEGQDGEAVVGVVDSIVFDGNKPRIVIGESSYDPRAVFKVEQAPPSISDDGSQETE